MIKVAIIGASGYTGADLVRLLSLHRDVKIEVLTANRNAGKNYGEVFSHLAGFKLPVIQTFEQADFSNCDVVFSCLPHGHFHKLIKTLPTSIKIIDLSADFRIDDHLVYNKWYGIEHTAKSWQGGAVYGLSEHNREKIKKSKLVACPGCYPTASLLCLLPIVKAGIISSDDIIIDAKSSISGMGRKIAKEGLFCERAEQTTAYSVGAHRHAPEIEQELSKAFMQNTKTSKTFNADENQAKKQNVIISFTPHLVPMNRGELVTIYVKRKDGFSNDNLKSALVGCYENEQFVRVIDTISSTGMVKGSNNCVISVNQDRVSGRSIIIAAIDNLIKGSSGQAVQNMNIMFGLNERTGLEQLAIFP